MLRDVVFAAAILQEPLLRRFGVGHGLLRGEGFRGDDEQRRFRIEPFQRIGDVLAIHIGDEKGAPSLDPVGPQSLRHHQGAEIRAANADIDDSR